MIDTYLSYRDSTFWVLDTRCVTHVYNDFQRLTSKKKLKKGEVELRMGNDTRVVVVTLGPNKPQATIQRFSSFRRILLCSLNS